MLRLRQSFHLAISYGSTLSIISNRTMATNSKVKIAVIQLNSTSDKQANLAAARGFIQEASKDGAKMAFLPECFDMICPSRKETMANGESIDGPTVSQYREIAKTNKIWLSLGGLHEKNVQSTDSRLFNAHIILNDSGDLVSIYRKTHLFNLDIPGTRLIESEFSQPGNAVIKPVETPAGNVGMGICYDLRFAEFSLALAKGGAHIISFPSSFTVPTGIAHWEVLLRTRAIETQCYVVAAGQVGAHNEKRSSYGHSMIISPWGDILAHISEDKPGYALAEIDFDHLNEVRRRLPVWTDRKPELYGLIYPASAQFNSPNEQTEDFHFGNSAVVKTYQIFAKTPLSIAFVNHRPVLPGHVLVSPLRSDAKRMGDLKPEEIFDLFSLIQKTQAAIEKIHGAGSSTIAIQDGIDAGQSVEHLHVHVVPRKSTDFGNVDEIYARLEHHDKPDNKFNLRLLTVEEMTNICNTLREQF